MPDTPNSPIDDYRKRQLGYLPILAIRIHQIPYELGDPRQSLSIELLKKDRSGAFLIDFGNVRDLQIQGVHPGTNCILIIESVAADQLEALRYRVFQRGTGFQVEFLLLRFRSIRTSIELEGLNRSGRAGALGAAHSSSACPDHAACVPLVSDTFPTTPGKIFATASATIACGIPVRPATSFTQPSPTNPFACSALTA